MPREQSKFQPVRLARHELFAALAQGGLVLTGNLRLSRSLMSEYEGRMVADGHAAWPTPRILPLQAWLLQIYVDAALGAADPLPRVLTAQQAEQLWAAIIAEDNPGLLQVDATAKRAHAAWGLTCEWQLQLADRRFGYNEDSTVFRRWANRFQALCGQQALASEAELIGMLAPLIASGACEVPARVILVGFYELVPGQQKLLGALRAAGCDAGWVEMRATEGHSHCVPADDAQHEMLLAATWARRILGDQPDARIGIVVPDLANRRSALTHILGKVLDPGSMCPGAASAPRPWNISLGQPLSAYPIVDSALALLALLLHPVDTTSLGVLLGSPHWALPRDSGSRLSELGRRALLDRRLRSLGDVEIPLATLRFHAGQEREDGSPRPWGSPRLSACLERMLALARELPERSGTAVWAANFTAWLSRARWGEGRPLDTHEFQVVEAWGKLLSVFSGLSEFAGELSRSQALNLLRRLAGDTIFQPQAADAPLQVLGLYEAHGLEFDYLWVMGMHDAVWPPAPDPNPFIPLPLQREMGLPHSDPSRTQAWADRVTEQLRRAAAEVIFSYPCRDGSEALRCSPLIATLTPLEADAVPVDAAPGWHTLVQRSATPERLPLQQPLPLTAGRVSGGTRIFSNQAACPFKAFAEHRLGASPLDRVQVGLGPIRSGVLLHRVLELLWRDLGSQAQLLALDEAALRARVREQIAQAVEAQRRRSPVTLTARYASIESRRLEDKVMRWLELERQRGPFAVVGYEQEHQFDAAGLRVRVYLDRIDELEDGSRVVLDYKTGQVRPARWFGERPEDPQLPVYAVAASRVDGAGPLAAVAFARIRPDSCLFSGVVREPGILPGLPADRKGPLSEASDAWPAVLEEWSVVLTTLARDFASGAAPVDPKHGLKTCEESYCELAALCRVRERLPGANDLPLAGREPSGGGAQNG